MVGKAKSGHHGSVLGKHDKDDAIHVIHTTVSLGSDFRLRSCLVPKPFSDEDLAITQGLARSLGNNEVPRPGAVFLFGRVQVLVVGFNRNHTAPPALAAAASGATSSAGSCGATVGSFAAAIIAASASSGSSASNSLTFASNSSILNSGLRLSQSRVSSRVARSFLLSVLAA